MFVYSSSSLELFTEISGSDPIHTQCQLQIEINNYLLDNPLSELSDNYFWGDIEMHSLSTCSSILTSLFLPLDYIVITYLSANFQGIKEDLFNLIYLAIKFILQVRLTN